MEDIQLPKRSDNKQKNRKKSGPPIILIGFGLLWILLFAIPEQWKSMWLSILSVAMSILIAILIDKTKMNSKTKWIISFFIYAVGTILYVLRN